MQTLEERCRKPDFQPGLGSVPIVLGDGSVWHFAKPKLVTRFVIDPVTKQLSPRREVTGLSVPLAELLAKILADDDQSVEVLMSVALDLLRRNYNIPDEKVGDLIWFDFENEVSVRMFRSLFDLVNGDLRPKATAPGSS